MFESMILPLMVILIFGIPHGAADGVLMLRRHLLDNSFQKFLFFFCYILIAIMVVAFWIVFPLLGLLSFLLLSIFHFGSGDARMYQQLPLLPLRRFLHGGAVVLFISFFHQDQTHQLYKILLQGSTDYISHFLKFLLALWVVGLAAYVFHFLVKRQLTLWPLIEITGLGILFYILPPLWGFAVYFCAIHSVRHFKSIYGLVDANGTLGMDFISILVISFITISAILGAALILPDYDYTTNLVRTVFIGLAALTVPHMLLIDFFPHRAHGVWVWLRGLSHE
ncbi:MAG: Brp/Blh family beta-carotene 15,15'-dioxygenase [Parvibaculales bacterium]